MKQILIKKILAIDIIEMISHLLLAFLQINGTIHGGIDQCKFWLTWAFQYAQSSLWLRISSLSFFAMTNDLFVETNIIFTRTNMSQATVWYCIPIFMSTIVNWQHILFVNFFGCVNAGLGNCLSRSYPWSINNQDI